MAWGTNTWGTGNWGDNPLDVNVSVTGFQLTSVLGTAVITVETNVTLTGFGLKCSTRK
jgi:hypothetical protein